MTNQGLLIVKADANYKQTHRSECRTKRPCLALRHVLCPDTGPESKGGKSVPGSRFPKLRQGVFVNNIHLEHLPEKS